MIRGGVRGIDSGEGHRVVCAPNGGRLVRLKLNCQTGGEGMLQKLIVALVLVLLTGSKVWAADTDLQQIADALDVSTTKTFQFTGNGSMYALGQSTSPAAPCPRSF